MKMFSRLGALALALILTLAAGAAGAETVSLSGTVEAGVVIPVHAPIGGTVETVSAEQGMRVSKGDTLLSYRTEKVYASEDGTVAGVFVTEGDDAETVAERYGADLYLEGTALYTVSASTAKAYSSVDTTFVHTGETVYLYCRTDTSRKGVGIITAVDGSSYTVTVTEGSFIAGDNISVYRDSAFTEKLRVGKGTAARVSPTAITGSGAVVRVAVQDGDTVKRGDLLMETLTGTFDAYEMTGTDVAAAEDGIVTEITAEAGSTVTKGDTVAKIAPISGMRVEAVITADDRNLLRAGDPVTIELESDEGRTYAGTVRYISEIPEEDTDLVSYKVIIDFTPDENVAFGMTVVVTAGEKSATIAGGDSN